MQLTVNGFSSMFTNLKHLYVWHHTAWSDLQEIGFPFLFTNHTGLETVILQGKYAQRHIINPDRLELVLEDIISYDSLKRLEMVLSHMDIGHLEYIMKRFPKMKKIRIQMLDRGTVGAVATSVEKVESIIEQLSEYSQGLECASIELECQERLNMVQITHMGDIHIFDTNAPSKQIS